MPQPVIVTFVGVPGSGKTTFARKLAKHLNAVVLNSDAIRMAMWGSLDAIQATHADKEQRKQANLLTFGAMNYAAQQAIEAGVSVVYDCNANRLAERAEKHDIAAKGGALSVVVRITVPYDVALQRVQERTESHDSRRISPEKAASTLERFTAEIEEPQPPELTVAIDGTEPFEQQLAVFERVIERATQ